jgi:hypothetical protein
MPYNPEEKMPSVDMEKVKRFILAVFTSYNDGLITKTEALDKLHTITHHNTLNHARVMEDKLFELIKFDINKL